MVLFLSFFFVVAWLSVVQKQILVFADTRQPGVAQNQSLRYELRFQHLSGNDTQMINRTPESLAWVNLTVLDISDNVLTLNQVQYNATSLLSNDTVLYDVGTGTSYPQMVLMFISGNLSAGEPVFTAPGQIPGLFINETIVTDWLGQSLETNHMRIGSTLVNFSGFGIMADGTLISDYYWEKATGVAVDVVYVYNLSRPVGGGNQLVSVMKEEFRLISATPVVPEFALHLIIPFLMIVALSAVVAYRRRITERTKLA